MWAAVGSRRVCLLRALYCDNDLRIRILYPDVTYLKTMICAPYAVERHRGRFRNKFRHIGRDIVFRSRRSDLWERNVRRHALRGVFCRSTEML